MKYLAILLIASASALLPEKLTPTKVAEGVTVSLPAELIPMTDEDIIQRYPSVRAPLAAYTNMNRDVDFSVNISATQWPDGDLEVAKKFFKSSFYNLYDRVDVVAEGIHTVHKKKMVFFEFDSRVNGNKLKEGEREPVFRYTYIQYLIEPKRTLVFSFNCPKNQKEEWQQVAQAMMKSVRIR